MIKTYLTDIKQFEEETVYNETLRNISAYRNDKIERLKHENDKRRSLGAAALLDKALREYGLKERDMEYELGEHGKPFLRAYPDIKFSISHSKDYAICSIGDAEVGNDIEWVRNGKENVAKRFFAAEELEWIEQAGDSEEEDRRFSRIWTVKESFLKVTGFGMSLPLKDFAAVMKEDGKFVIRHEVNDKTYYVKEYMIPVSFDNQPEYRIAVCSTEADFAQSTDWSKI